MLLNFAVTLHPVFLGTSALERGQQSSRSRTLEAHRLSGLVGARLDCCGESETEEDPESGELGGHVDAHAECEGTGGVFAVDGFSML